MLIEQDDIAALHRTQDSLALELLLLRLAQVLRVAQVGDNLYIKGYIVLETLYVRLDQSGQLAASGFAYYK